MLPSDLAERWRTKAAQVLELGAEAQARTLEWCASDLEEHIDELAEAGEEVRRAQRPDRLLTAKEVAERLSVGDRWVYRHAGTLPFTRKLTDGTLRFSERGLVRWV